MYFIALYLTAENLTTIRRTLALASTMRVLARASAPSITRTRPHASSAPRVARPRAVVVVARASGEEDEPSTATESAEETSATAEETSASANDGEASSSSPEDIGAAIRAAKEAKADEGANVFAGAAEEVGLIEWPTVGGALSTTALVMAGIFGSASVLLGVNGVLSELSQKLFP